jgi:threonine dehydrogenase-like Zn-dependent dehydrogenase
MLNISNKYLIAVGFTIEEYADEGFKYVKVTPYVSYVGLEETMSSEPIYVTHEHPNKGYNELDQKVRKLESLFNGRGEHCILIAEHVPQFDDLKKAVERMQERWKSNVNV